MRIFVCMFAYSLHLVAAWSTHAAFRGLWVICTWQLLESGLCASGPKLQILIGA